MGLGWWSFCWVWLVFYVKFKFSSVQLVFLFQQSQTQMFKIDNTVSYPKFKIQFFKKNCRSNLIFVSRNHKSIIYRKVNFHIRRPVSVQRIIWPSSITLCIFFLRSLRNRPASEKIKRRRNYGLYVSIEITNVLNVW